MARGHIHVAPTIAPSVIHDIGQGGWLESRGLAITLITAGVVVAGLGLARGWMRRRSGAPRRSRLHRWLATSATAAVAATLGLGGAAVAVNNYVGYVPTLGSVVSTHALAPVLAGGRTLRVSSAVRSSTVVKLSIAAPTLGLRALPAYVYLPPGYWSPANARRRYPTLYLIHGHPGGAIDWFRAGRVQRTLDILLRDHLVDPMIVVAPSASPKWLKDTECLNQVGGPQMETYLTQTVPATINRDFRTHAGRAFTAIGGMSSGAYCAVNLALRHPHVFSIVAASEPFTDPGQKADQVMLGSDPALVWANSPGRYLYAIRPLLPQAFFLDAGGHDRRTSANLALLAHELANDGQDVVIREVPNGGHTWLTARLELPYALVFASQHFGRLPAGGSYSADARFDNELLRLGETHRDLGTSPPRPGHVVPTPRTPSPSPRPSGARSRRSGPRATATP